MFRTDHSSRALHKSIIGLVLGIHTYEPNVDRTEAEKKKTTGTLLQHSSQSPKERETTPPKKTQASSKERTINLSTHKTEFQHKGGAFRRTLPPCSLGACQAQSNHDVRMIRTQGCEGGSYFILADVLLVLRFYSSTGAWQRVPKAHQASTPHSTHPRIHFCSSRIGNTADTTHCEVQKYKISRLLTRKTVKKKRTPPTCIQ